MSTLPDSSIFGLTSVSSLVMLGASILLHRLILTCKTSKESKPRISDDLGPLDTPPPGLGLGREDPVVSYYVKNIDDNHWAETPSGVDDKDKGTPDDWINRHPDLVRLTGRHPFNCEPLLPKLMEKGYITPHNLHYVRTHGATPRIIFSEHRVYVGGSVSNPLTLSMTDIMALPSRSIPVTLVCCGNRRKEQNMIKQTIGFNWGAGGVSTGVWTGVRLLDILKLAGVTSCEEGYHVRFASDSSLGGDKLPGGIYGTSVPLRKALDPSQDILVAYMYNGQMLAPDHGFPVRIIIPGYIGGRMIKWLTNIDLLTTESQDYYHFFDNRVLPPHVDAEIAKAEGWWFKPEYICNDLSVNSAISSPGHDEVISIANPDEIYTLKGYAYTGGGRKITRVEISLDSGANWRLCNLQFTEKPTEYGKYWTWIFWNHDLTVKELCGKHEIVLRAWDEGHNTQPDKPTWNLMGMLNNPWFRIKIHPTDVESKQSLIFEHPTLAGNQPGGWMVRNKGDPSFTAPMVTMPSTDRYVPAVTEVVEAKPVIAFDNSKPSFSMDEVRKHNNLQSSWIVVKNKVYDATPFLKDHPGGSDSIILAAGADSTEEFEAIHSKKAWKMLEDYYIGQLRVSDGDTVSTTSESTIDEEITSYIALNPRKRIPFTLILKEKLSPDSFRLRFALQSSSHILGLPIGQHMLFSANIDGKMVMRAYTPVSSDADKGYFDLVIKVYYANVSKEFPAGGIMSQYLGNLSIGDSIEVKGPLGHVTYLSRGILRVHDHSHNVKKFALLCGGTGITPIYQIIVAVLSDSEDKTELHMIYSNRNEEDILLRNELDIIVNKYPGRIHMHHTLTGTLISSAWSQLRGRPDEAMIKKCVPQGDSETFALMCGPRGLLDAFSTGLGSHGYDDDHIIYF